MKARFSRVLAFTASAMVGVAIWLILDPVAEIDLGRGWHAAYLPSVAAATLVLGAIFDRNSRAVVWGNVSFQMLAILTWGLGDDGLGGLGIFVFGALALPLHGVAWLAGSTKRGLFARRSNQRSKDSVRV